MATGSLPIAALYAGKAQAIAYYVEDLGLLLLPRERHKRCRIFLGFPHAIGVLIASNDDSFGMKATVPSQSLFRDQENSLVSICLGVPEPWSRTNKVPPKLEISALS